MSTIGRMGTSAQNVTFQMVIFLSSCPLSEGMSELPFFTTKEKTKRLLTLLTIGLSSRNLWYSQLKDEDEGIGWGWVLSFGKTSLNQNLKRQEEKKRIIHRKIQCASIPFGAKKTPCS